MKTTLRDVAEAAGVSAMSVSAVLHGTGKNVKVSEEKAEQIRRAAKELNYQPNHLARSLRNQKTRMVGLVFQHFDRLSEQNPYYPQVLNGVMTALFREGYTLALCPDLALKASEGSISDGRFDGILWCRPDFSDASVEGLRRASIPVVMMHAPPGSAPGIPTFCADSDGAMNLVVEHLVGQGHEKLGFVIDPVSEPTAEGRARADAFLRACKGKGVSGDVLVWHSEATNLEAYRLGAGPHTALAAFSDHMAGQLLRACHRYGIRVPHELSIVGFDSSLFCDTTTPKLTAVYQPVERIAFEATSHLLSLIRGEVDAKVALPRSTIYDCGLDVRESTGKPPASARRNIPC